MNNPQNTPITYTIGGTVQAGNGYYVERQADRELLDLCLQGEFAYVLTARQMGKSSLMTRTAEELRKIKTEIIIPVIVDLQEIGGSASQEEWYFGFLLAVADQLELETDLYDWWDEQRSLGITQRVTRFFAQVILPQVAGRIVIFVDEIDTTLSLNYTDDFFIAIRYFFTTRSTNPDFKRLSFVLLGVATPGELIVDSKRTPFNIGKRVDLMDFSEAEAQPLAAGLALDSGKTQAEIFAEILDWTGGHPYLTQRMCGAVRAQFIINNSELSIDSLVQHLFLGEQSEKDTHLQFVRDMLTVRAPEGERLGLLQIYRDIWRGRKVLDEEQSILKNHLKLSGVVKRQRQQLIVRNRVYAAVFDETWLREHWPLNLWQRLKPALPFIAASFVVTGVVGWLGIVAYGNAQRAEEALAVAKLREQAAVVLNWLPTRKAPQALALAIQTYTKSKALHLRTAESSLLSAVQEEKETNRFQGHTAWVRSVAFSPDGKTIVSGSDDNTVRLWDLQGNPIGKTFQGHTSSVNSVAFSPDGKTIVSGSDDNTVRLWDLQGNPIGQPFQGHTSSVNSVAFSPDGKTIVSGSDDKTLRIWDLQGNPIGKTFQGHTSSVWSVAFSPDGKTIVSGSVDKTLRIWDLQGNSIGQPFQGHTSSIFSVVFSPDGKTIVSGSYDNTVRLWDLEGTPIGQPFQGHTGWVRSVVFSPDGKTIVSGSYDNTVRLWDLEGTPIGQPFQGHTSYVLSVAFSPNGKTIVSGSFDNTVRLWDLEGNPLGQPFQGHTSDVSSVAFSPDGKTIVSGSGDKTVRLWDLEGNPIGQPLQGHTDWVRSVAFSPDGKTIVSGSGDKTVRLWDLEGNPIGQALQGHTSYVLSVAFSPDGKTIVSGSDDNTIRLWDLEGNPLGQPFQGHTDWVRSVVFSPDGKTIVSGSRDNTIRLWDLEGNPLGQPFQGHTSYVSSVVFSPDGKTIVSGSHDNTLRLWAASPDAWLRIGCDRLRYHPLFRDPEQEIQGDQELLQITIEAREACQSRFWNGQ